MGFTDFISTYYNTIDINSQMSLSLLWTHAPDFMSPQLECNKLQFPEVLLKDEILYKSYYCESATIFVK
jgi:hypothetical protein